MVTSKVVAAVVVIALVVVAGASYYEFFSAPSPGCASVTPGAMSRTTLSGTSFGGVTEYRLPSQDRWPSAVTTAPDGSVWFAEEEVPGVAHFFPGNGTLVEYAWPGYATPKPPDCIPGATTSGIALWQGRVWAADEYNNAIFGVNPADGSTVRVNTTSNARFPYWLAVGPDGNLWFTSENTPAALGRISPNLTLSIIQLKGLGNDQPIQLTFVNSSYALLDTINQAENTTTKGCICSGHIYSFDPSNVTSSITPEIVGGNYALTLPTMVTFVDGRMWVAQHLPSNVLSYDFATGQWTSYPTSTVPWSTTLPLEILANGSRVWFNEHYANKIAFIDSASWTLTEISESNPPAATAAGIQNDESIALGSGGVWFTSLSGNYLGFISANYRPAFQIASEESGSLTMSPGQNATLQFRVTGTWSSALEVNMSDTESFTSVPKLIQLVPSVAEVPPGGTPYVLTVHLTLAQSIKPGSYVVAVTLTEGGVQQSAYAFLQVA